MIAQRSLSQKHKTSGLRTILLVLSLIPLAAGAAQATKSAANRGDSPTGSRGEMLYSTHCIACHTTQVHWRDQRLAHDWDSLKQQVRRWATNTGLQWEQQDVDAVADYLNRMYYDFPADKEQKRFSHSDKK